MNRHHRGHFPILLVALGLFFCVLPPARANMADPARPGDPVGEPSPLLDSIHVPEEQLVIDMRPVAEQLPASVKATYRLRNDGGAKKLDLVFVAGGFRSNSVSSFTVMLDGVTVPGRFSDSLYVPSGWQMPRFTPGFGGKDSLPYEILLTRSAGRSDIHGGDRGERLPATVPAIFFSVDLSSGYHTLSVTYTVDPTGYGYIDPVYIHQLGYVLSPARRWGSFGRLDAQVVLPKGWEAATWPQMEREGDTLFGVWNGLPADALALSARMPVSPTLYALAFWGPVFFFLVMAGLLTYRLGWKKGVKLARQGGKLTGAIPLAILCTWLTVLLLGGGLMAGDVWQDSIKGNQAIPGYPNIMLFLYFAFFPPSLLVFLVPSPVTMVAAAIARRRALPDAGLPESRNTEPADGI